MAAMNDSIHVLLIDEDPAWCAFASQALSSGGFTSSHVATPAHALDFVSGIVPEVIICNCNLPELDAPNVMMTLRSETALADVPVLITSNSPSREKAQAARAAGASDFLPKPAAPGEIVAKVARAVLFAF